MAQSASTTRSGYPSGWPDAAAKWLWPTNPDAAAPAGRCWFRSTFTVTTAGPVGIFATADNTLSLSVNGDVVLETDPSDLYSWRQFYSYTVTLQPGTYTVAARVDNAAFTGSNPAGFLATIATLDGNGIPVTVLRHTDTTNWLTHSYAPPEPGWHAASILKQALAESAARSEKNATLLTVGFTDSLDSASVSWTDIQSERFPIGSDLLTVAGRLIELGIDVDVTPSMVVYAYARKGADLSATIRLLPGVNIVTESPTSRSGAVRNSAIIRHGTGWVLAEDAASIALRGRFATSLTLGATDSATQATQQATSFFLESAHPQITLPVRMSSATGPVPFRDFTLGDTVTVPGLYGGIGTARVMSIAAVVNDVEIAYDLSLYPEVA